MKVLDVKRTVAKEAIYIETGKLKIEYLVKMKRLSYYWHILKRDTDELIARIYKAQTLKQEKNDWVSLVKKDKENLEINMNDDDIKLLTKSQFKKLIKNKLEIFARKEFEELKKNKHSKSKFLNMFSSKPQSYLLSRKLNLLEIQTLFKLRTRMADVKNNFKNQNSENIWCITCKLFAETQEHLLQCNVIKNMFIDHSNFNSCRYSFIYGTLEEQELAAKVFTLIFEKRKDFTNINNPPSQEKGQSTDSVTQLS